MPRRILALIASRFSCEPPILFLLHLKEMEVTPPPHSLNRLRESASGLWPPRPHQVSRCACVFWCPFILATCAARAGRGGHRGAHRLTRLLFSGKTTSRALTQKSPAQPRSQARFGRHKARTMREIVNTEPAIREFLPHDAAAFRDPNEEWIARYFVMEPNDHLSLAAPPRPRFRTATAKSYALRIRALRRL